MNDSEALLPGAYWAGHHSYYRGAPEDNNPFDPQSDNYLSWRDGWIAAQEEQEG